MAKRTKAKQRAKEASPSVDDVLHLEVDGLRYSLDEAPQPGRGKVVASVASLASDEDSPFRDRVDLYASKDRRRFGRLIADTYARDMRDVVGHLALLLDRIERARATSAHSENAVPELSPARRDAACALLEREDLLDAAAGVMEALGYVGEEQVKRLGYLVATSRLLAKPLSAILLAPSGSGKSELLEVLTQLLPPHAVEFLSRISPAALYYAGADWLRHKLILVDESSGAADADYAVRTLQSKGYLRLAVPLKGRTEQFVAKGPIALMSGSTSSTINPENLSRCLQLALDDSAEQTRRIQSAQRAAWAGRSQRTVDLTPWRDAQTLLESLPVTIPYAEQLAFPARTTHDRRGNQKLLGLVAAHALLHQRQRDRDPQHGVVATQEDYAAVYALLAPQVAGEVEGLSARAERAYRALASEPGARTRRELASLLGWGYNTAKRALTELVAQELVTRTDPGPPARYRLLDRTLLGACADLVSPAALRSDLPKEPAQGLPAESP